MLCRRDDSIVAGEMHHLAIWVAHKGRLVGEAFPALGTQSGLIYFEALVLLLGERSSQSCRFGLQQAAHDLTLVAFVHLGASHRLEIIFQLMHVNVIGQILEIENE